eukprot:gb/GECG01012788.1/.p1 GENE.gb/GECG01012788.1/~~gb/GECG01012788.1/.p1  ORF type:complete len:1600 (+),score=274.54 gb/GECG01012788.1/:1-4800(+)
MFCPDLPSEQVIRRNKPVLICRRKMQANLFSFFGKKDGSASKQQSPSSSSTSSHTKGKQAPEKKVVEDDDNPMTTKSAVNRNKTTTMKAGETKTQPKSSSSSPGSREPTNDNGTDKTHGQQQQPHKSTTPVGKQSGQKQQEEKESFTPAKSPAAVNDDSDSDEDVATQTKTGRKKLRKRAEQAKQGKQQQKKSGPKKDSKKKAQKKQKRVKADLSDGDDSEAEDDDESSEFSGGDESSSDESLGSFVVAEKESDGEAQSEPDTEDDDDEPPAKKPSKKKAPQTKKQTGATKSAASSGAPQTHNSFMEKIEAEAGSGSATGQSMAEVASNIAQRNRLGHSWGYGRTKQGYSPDLKSDMARKKYGYGGTKITDETAKRSGMFPAGEHLHDTLPWLYEERKDAEGRPQDHPDFNPRTLFVPKEFLENKKYCTPAGKQWWEFKSHNMDTLLCFKQGKFYELFHMDADVLVRELDCIYMKGFQAHAGFPESAYGRFSEQLVDRGFRISRVEQTETPQELAERKKVTKGPKPQVVRRELCGIKSRGTRLHGDMDVVQAPEDASVSVSNIGCTDTMEQWLLSLTETPLRDNREGTTLSEEDDDRTHIGACCVDTATDRIVLTEFVDDRQRTKLRTMMARMPPAELVYRRNGLTEITQRFLRYDAAGSVRTELNNEEIPPNAIKPSNSKQSGVNLPKKYTGETYSPKAAIASCIHRNYFGTAEQEVSQEDDFGSDNLDKLPWSLRAAVQNAQRHSWESHLPGSNEEETERCLGVLALYSFGSVLYHLQRCLIERELLTAKRFASYSHNRGVQWEPVLSEPAKETNGEEQAEEAVELEEGVVDVVSAAATQLRRETEQCDKMSMDANTLLNLEILENSYDGGTKGTLFSILDGAFSAFGRRILREWVTKPLYRVQDIEKRLCAVENLMGNFPASGQVESQKALCKAGLLLAEEDSVDASSVEDIQGKADKVRSMLSGMPDLERILARIHRNSSKHLATEHPQARAMMYEAETYSKRRMRDLTTALRGFHTIQKIRNLFVDNTSVHPGVVSRLLNELVYRALPDLSDILQFFDNAFDPKEAEKYGYVVPRRGVDNAYDAACDEIRDIKEKLEDFRKSQEKLIGWKIKYIDMMKDRFLLEIPENMASKVPNSYEVKSQRKGKDPVRRFWTPEIKEYLEELEAAEKRREDALRDSTRALFERFDAHRGAWSAATTCVGILDALLALAYWSQHGDGAGMMCRPQFVCHEDAKEQSKLAELWPTSTEAFSDIKAGRHPCITVGLQDGSGSTLGFSSYVPNDVVLGKERPLDASKTAPSAGGRGVNAKEAPCVLLTGPNMGGKSTLLRQTCMATILAQIGGYVPAEAIRLTPVDRIFTRVGASDRILAGQSTFFVELAETSTILHSASSQSLVILDELGRGTSTFDGNAIAYAVTRNLTKKVGTRTLFATHYHTLCEEFEQDPKVDMAHMDCMVEDGKDTASSVTFLYRLKHGACPKSYGLNVARLARLPEEVIQRAKEKSEEFEKSLETVMELEKRPRVGEKRQCEQDSSPTQARSTSVSPYGASQLLERFLSVTGIQNSTEINNPEEVVNGLDDAVILSFWSEAQNLSKSGE